MTHDPLFDALLMIAALSAFFAVLAVIAAVGERVIARRLPRHKLRALRRSARATRGVC